MQMKDAIKEIGISTYYFYNLRAAGIIPAPQSGYGVKKYYSAKEVNAIKASLKKGNE